MIAKRGKILDSNTKPQLAASLNQQLFEFHMQLLFVHFLTHTGILYQEPKHRQQRKASQAITLRSTSHKLTPKMYHEEQIVLKEACRKHTPLKRTLL